MSKIEILLGGKTSNVKCEDAKIDQDFLTEDLPKLIKDIPKMIEAEKKH